MVGGGYVATGANVHTILFDEENRIDKIKNKYEQLLDDIRNGNLRSARANYRQMLVFMADIKTLYRFGDGLNQKIINSLEEKVQIAEKEIDRFLTERRGKYK